MSTAQVDIASPAHAPDSTAPRKRRRRAPTTGAADDCFTCSSRGEKCDRRRPYCSRCLDDGKDCSGYKTTLTWGVGVASRGKLRGLSLPIAGTAKASSPTSANMPRKRSSVTGERPNRIHTSQPSFPSSLPPTPTGPLPVQYATVPAFDFVHSEAVSPHGMMPSPHWSHPGAVPIPPQMPVASRSVNPPHHLQPLNVSVHKFPEEINMPTSASSLGGFSEASFGSPVVYSASSDESAYLNVPQHTNSGHRLSFNEAHPLDIHNSTSWPGSDLNFACGSAVHDSDVFDPTPKTEPFLVPHSTYNEVNGRSMMKKRDEEDIEDVVYGTDTSLIASPVDTITGFFSDPFAEHALAPSPYSSFTAIGKTPRMRYLINYYTEVISPVIVAFDGPNNPYRTHILKLAANSETLQHAIAALSASNLRQRTENNVLSTCKTDPARRSSMAHCALTDHVNNDHLVLSKEAQATEEKFHKGMSIQSLNAALADPIKRRDDSVLATLLILCLFHICDSGVAKFKTQFAGVKKLLGLRGHDLGSNSRETKWYTRMFTWFDAFTATVNEREGQLQGTHLDVSSLSDEEWAMENLAGCDGRLFKTIAQLGRLNVLSQGKRVQEKQHIVPRPPTMFSDIDTFDGDSWSNILADEDLFQSNSDDPRTQFWREWREIRQELQSWQLDTSIFDSTSATPLTLDQKVDLSNISESFRYSALLYTERLANPTASSDDPKIQDLVERSLFYIREVKSDVYLLWPLFITGSECVKEEQISVIRQRCLDIQKDSGFLNNYSCLELLEKVWKRKGVTDEKGKAKPEGFKWRGVMDAEKSEGEYIVV